jgi:hypothetical protein
MLRPYLTTAAVALLGASAIAQGDLKSRLQPITSPFRHAGVFHVATGTWTRNSQLSNLTGPDTIYNNSCATAYFFPILSDEQYEHRSRVPTLGGAPWNAPTTVNPFDPLKNDEAPGCAESYVVNGFEFLYCSSRVGPFGAGVFDYDQAFASAYLACGASDMVRDVTFNITGLPGGTPAGAQICWIVDIDLDAASLSFTLAADQDGTWVGPSTSEQFGWSQGPTTPGITGAMATGPVIAGNFTWPGGPFTGPLPMCSGTDGTIWDSPINLAEAGTGMSSNDFFRITGNTANVPSGPGCYFFGGTTIHSDFYLKLFSDPQCAPTPPLVQNCIPGVGTTTALCPCSNPPVAPGLGCNNFGAGPVPSGLLDGSGVASLAADTLSLNVTGENNTSLSVFFTASGVQGSGLAHAGGVRCIITALKRLGTHGAVAGATSYPIGADLSVSARSAALGVPISAGQTRHYQTIYRDPNAAGPCGNVLSTVNLTNAGSVTWSL